jgi:hypothetical protein
MSRRLRTPVIAAALGLALGAVDAGTARADPTGAPYSRLLSADCGSGPISMVANGVGDWHSAQVVDSTAVFVPLAVEDSGVFTDPSGVEHPFSHPLTQKGSASPNGHPVVDCRFSVDTTFPDGSRLVANGTLTGFFTS